jgi:hypothetical protein
VLNVPKVKGGGVRDRLNVLWTVTFCVCARNALPIHNPDHPWEGASKIRILQNSIADVPIGVHVQMHEIRQASDVLGAGCAAASQISESVKVHRVGAFRFQIDVEIRRVADFVEGVAGDVL